MPLPGKDERSIGGHAVLATGYDDRRQHFMVMNSWSAAWGDKGYFYLPYAYAHRPHLLILGCARIGGSDYRFNLYVSDGANYCAIDPARAPVGLPVLFKPMGAPSPRLSYIASDADYVDYITELMGGFAVPSFVKAMRRGKRYLLLGMRLNRDSERMVFSDLIYDAATGPAGWALIAEPTDKERRFCKRQGIEVIDATIGELLREWSAEALAA